MDCKLRAKNCGGCPMLGMDYAAQLKQKEETVKKLLGRFGPVEHIRGMETPYHYRNKVISTFTTGWGGKLTSGIYAANSHKVLPVESCLLQDEVLDKTMLAVRAAAGICHYQPFNEDKGTGLLRHCLLRRGVMTGQVMVVLVTAQPVLPGAKNFVKALLTEAEKQSVTITTIVQNVNDRKTSVVLGDMEKVLYGKGFILDELCGKTYALSPRSFYQINHTQPAGCTRRRRTHHLHDGSFGIAQGCRPGNEGKAPPGPAHLMQKRALIAMQYSALHHRTWKTPTVQKPCRNRAAMAYKTKKP